MKTKELQERKKKLIYFEKYHDEYGSVSPCIVNSYKKRSNKEGNITYYYISPEETENTIKLNGIRAIPVTIPEKEYKKICACDWREYKTNKKHAVNNISINRYYDDEGVEKEKQLPRSFYETTSDSEKQWCEDMDFENIIKKLSPLEQRIAWDIKYGYTQKDIAEDLNISQGTVSKKLKKIYYILKYDKYNNGERTKKEIEYEIAWEDFLNTHAMPNHEEITFEIYKRLIPLGGDLYYLKRFFTIKTLQYFAYKVIFFYSSFDKDSIENEIKLLPLKRQELYHKYLENEQDVFNTKQSTDTFSDGYDLASEAICFLLQNIGKRFSDKIKLIKYGVPKEFTILNGCYFVVSKYLRTLTTQDNKLLDIDNPIVEELCGSYDILETYDNNTEDEWNIVEDIISKLNLTPQLRQTLDCFIDGKGFSETARILGCAVSTTFHRREILQRKYLAID